MFGDHWFSKLSQYLDKPIKDVFGDSNLDMVNVGYQRAMFRDRKNHTLECFCGPNGIVNVILIDGRMVNKG